MLVLILILGLVRDQRFTVIMSRSCESAGSFDVDGGRNKENAVSSRKRGESVDLVGVRKPLGDLSNFVGKRDSRFDFDFAGSGKGKLRGKKFRIGDFFPTEIEVGEKKDGEESVRDDKQRGGVFAWFLSDSIVGLRNTARSVSDDVKDVQIDQVPCPSTHVPTVKGKVGKKRFVIGDIGTGILPIEDQDAELKAGRNSAALVEDGEFVPFHIPRQTIEIASDDEKDVQINQMSCPSQDFGLKEKMSEKGFQIGDHGTDISPVKGHCVMEKDAGKSVPSEDPDHGDCEERQLVSVTQPHQNSEIVDGDVRVSQINQSSFPSHVPTPLDNNATSLSIDKNELQCTDYALKAIEGNDSKDSCNASAFIPTKYNRTNEILPGGSKPVGLPSDETFSGTDPSIATCGMDVSVKNDEILHVASSAQSLTSNDFNVQFIDSQESAVNCGTEISRDVLTNLIHSRASDCRTINFGLVKPYDIQGDEGKNCSDNGLNSAKTSSESIKNSSCPICLKASSVLSELHYEDYKGRLIEVKRSIKQVRSMIEKNYGHGISEESLMREGRGNVRQSSTLEADLAHHWKALFLHTENALLHESSQIQSSLKKLKGMNENYKKDLEMAKASSHRNS